MAGPDDLRALALHEAALLLVMTEAAPDEAAAAQMVEAVITSGKAFAAFAAVVAAQGGDVRTLEDPSLLPHALIIETVTAPEDGYIADLDPLIIGRAAMRLGAGRERKEDIIDPAVGLVLRAKPGDHVTQGASLCDIHARTAAAAARVRDDILRAYRYQQSPVTVPPLIKEVIGMRTSP